MTDKIKDIINNFSDMKIIKALECCIIGDCDNCPFYETRELCPNLILFVSDLIKRQKAEIAELESEIATLKHSNINLQELYYAQKEKVAKSKQKVIDVCRQLQTAKAEIERLQKAVEDKGGLILIETAKAEAYREFAVRLLSLIGSVELPNLELRRHINNLLNELVGDSNG